jgi:hypothetical protein
MISFFCSSTKFKNLLIPMRDGVRLATDIYRPARDGALSEGQFPIILCRTSYDKSAQRYVDIADFFTPRGYVVALQDLRGRGESEGTGQYFHVVNVNEGKDGYDTIEWLAAQPWSNGKVGMVGSSHPALTQVLAALYRPPHLTTIWPDVTPINGYQHQQRRGGAMQLQMFGALFVHALDAPEIRDNPAAKRVIVNAMEQLRELVYATPFKAGHTPLVVVPNLEQCLMDYYTRGTYDEYWAQEASDFTRQFHRHADIPIMLTGGWFDLFADGTPQYFAAMRKQNTAPVRLIMGPWTHTQMRNGISYAGDVDCGDEAVWGNARYFEEQLRWFDRWLKGSSEFPVLSPESEAPSSEPQHSTLSTQDSELDPPVRIFVMGGGDGRRNRHGHLNHGGRWRDEHAWPLARTQYTTFYLHPDHTLSTKLPNPKSQIPTNQPSHQSTNQPTSQPTNQLPITNYSSPLRFTYDPHHPVPTIGASSSGLMELVSLGDGLDPFWGQNISPWLRLRSIILEGAAHQKEAAGMIGAQPPYLLLAMRLDVLVFQTSPLEHDVEVTGEIVVKLWIASSAVDTDFTAKLVDVYPPNADYPEGYHLNLSDSIIRCRYRNSWEREELMTPNEIYPVTISLAPTSNLFKAGHRIRIDISSSNFPRFDLNPNTGEPMGRHTHNVVAHNALYCDAEHPSHVVLPIIPQ